ncbi:DNA circularization protein [Salmonella enterica]|uniref:DNA circularization protein n=1 Tax=Salmonella enterica TaxID=28901 RepID=UPI000A322D15|nr:DNA circularization N-terminal domain-containing protein [Salmonella enterica]EHJ7193384.1 DNA circularization protein [Salmonella enterica subsp. enterica serovar Victoria]EHJ7449333.1 DNA circularization protein [Salmonella enterica subsp. enterica serovar Victoria]
MFESTVNSINGVRDYPGLKRADSGQGTFRNVPFLILKEQKQSGGRRIVKREYPLRETGGVNDLGRKLRERSFSACVLGKNADKVKDALIEALDAPGAGELVHPDFGSASVMVDTWECRNNADESDYFEFTITVYPAATDNAPESQQNTAAAVSSQKDSLFGSLGDTLSDAWQYVQEGTAGAAAVLDAITGVVDDIYDTVENVGVLQDVNSLLSSLSALKGSVSGLLNQPAMLGANVLGALSGLSDILDASTAFSAYGRLNVHLKSRQSSIDVNHKPAAAVGNVAALFHVAGNASLISQAAAASGVLTQTIESSNSESTTPRSPEISARVSRTSSVSSPVTGSQLNTITTIGNSASVISTDEVQSESHPIFESYTDIERVALEIGEQMDAAALLAADSGFITDSNGITHMRLLTVYDLRNRGLRLPGVTTTTLKRSEPALVALYRVTGNSRQWQRMARRNGVKNPLFVPGGIEVEVIDE